MWTLWEDAFNLSDMIYIEKTHTLKFKKLWQKLDEQHYQFFWDNKSFQKYKINHHITKKYFTYKKNKYTLSELAFKFNTNYQFLYRNLVQKQLTIHQVLKIYNL